LWRRPALPATGDEEDRDRGSGGDYGDVDDWFHGGEE
jgi:hypothetical protein